MAESTSVRGKYIATTAVFVVVAVPVGLWIANITPVKVTPVEGIAAFAILYVLAQAIERINQILVPLLDFLLSKIGADKRTATDKKRAALMEIRTQRALLRANPVTLGEASSAGASAATGEEVVTAANVEKALLTNGLAFLLAMVAVGLFKFSLLASIGYTAVPSSVDLVVTATAIMGGSAGLSDLISKIQKSKTENETSGA